ncbi:arylamine N-acetyltransferase [Streptomyces sp. NPDC001941]|uniref:arylamine N-acetyltransferase family protein n=1 Tax=Streptomyces sp. NPDC001941 TaxID=3154659 RepID=UPI00332DECE9
MPTVTTPDGDHAPTASASTEDRTADRSADRASGPAPALTGAQADAYLRRIGAEGVSVGWGTGEGLRELHLRHLRSVPFENLSLHLGEDVVLAEQALFDKVVGARRGGFCYELNGLFAALLRTLGYRVDLLEARCFREDGGLSIPYDHMVLRVVDEEGRSRLADVGFGDHSQLPLELGERGEQADPGGVFRIVEAPEGDLDVVRDGTPQYRVDPRPRALGDFEVGSWYQRTSPASHFTRSLVCSRLTEEGRVTLRGAKLIVTDCGGRRERWLSGEEEVLAAYRDLFGVELDRLPHDPAAGQDASPAG